jgi:hypothetical protein
LVLEYLVTLVDPEDPEYLANLANRQHLGHLECPVDLERLEYLAVQSTCLIIYLGRFS